MLASLLLVCAIANAQSTLSQSKANDRARAAYWADRGHHFDPAYMTASMMDRAVQEGQKTSRPYQGGVDPHVARLPAVSRTIESTESRPLVPTERPASSYFSRKPGYKPRYSGSRATSHEATTTRLTPFTFRNWRTGDGRLVTGTTTRIGRFRFHDFSSSRGETMNGTSTRIGNFIFHDFTNSTGNRVHGTTTIIGGQTFTDWNE